jgi:hypothetical protein
VVGWRRLRPWGLGIAACAAVLAFRGAWVGTAFVGLVWLGYLAFVRVDRCCVERVPGAVCDEVVSGVLGTCYAHRGDKWRVRPRLARGGPLGLRLRWPTATAVGAPGSAARWVPPPAGDPRRRLMDGLGLAGLVVSVISVVSDLMAR